MVTAVGPDVTDHKVGDQVGGMSGNGCWATFVTCDAHLATPMPDGLTDAQAAAVTTASATAWYGLQDLARIRAGDKVLIHSATGGVGQAAIAIARAAGAEIYRHRRQRGAPTAAARHGDRACLRLPQRRVRRTDPPRHRRLRRDIVLNSVFGAAQLAGVKLLAQGGQFVEIGKRDIYGDTKLGLFPFRQNLSFYGLDLGLLSISHPAAVRELLSTVYRRPPRACCRCPSARATRWPRRPPRSA